MDLPETRYVRGANGLHLAYHVFGDGPLDLICGYGPASNLEIVWEEPRIVHLHERLGRFARVCVFDRRGTGLSDPVEGTPTLEQHMEDLLTVADAAGFERPALFGASEAARMMLLTAASYPERVASVVAFGASAVGAAVLSPEILESLREIVASQYGTGSIMDLFAPSLAGDAVKRRWMGRLERHAASPGVAQRIIDMSIRTDIRPILPAVRVPVLVLHRREDQLVPLQLARDMAAAMPNATLVELEGTDNLTWTGDLDALVDEMESFLTGAAPTREPDRQLATVLITDIVGSTQRAAQLGDAHWRQVLDFFYETVRTHLARHRGREIKTVGDAVVATFEGPARAVRAARELTQALAVNDLPVRSGVHTGEIEILPDDITGLAVNIAARVAAAAQPGEVLVSRTVRDLVVGSELVFTPRGTHELRGVPGQWELHAAMA